MVEIEENQEAKRGLLALLERTREEDSTEEDSA